MKTSVIIQMLLATVNPFDVIVVILAVGAVVGFVVYSIWKKKNGKGGGCGCGCNGCAAAGTCPSRAAIKNEQATDVVGLLKRYKGIKGVFTNGKKSAEVFEKYNRLNYVCLPSTSPANAVYSYEKLFLAWKEQLDKFI